MKLRLLTILAVLFIFTACGNDNEKCKTDKDCSGSTPVCNQKTGKCEAKAETGCTSNDQCTTGNKTVCNTTTGECEEPQVTDCGGVTCESYQECKSNTCELKDGMCASAADCKDAAKPNCNSSHMCVGDTPQPTEGPKSIKEVNDGLKTRCSVSENVNANGFCNLVGADGKTSLKVNLTAIVVDINSKGAFWLKDAQADEWIYVYVKKPVNIETLKAGDLVEIKDAQAVEVRGLSEISLDKQDQLVVKSSGQALPDAEAIEALNLPTENKYSESKLLVLTKEYTVTVEGVEGNHHVTTLVSEDKQTIYLKSIKESNAYYNPKVGVKISKIEGFMHSDRDAKVYFTARKSKLTIVDSSATK